MPLGATGLLKAHHTATQDYDKAVFTLAGGALGISLAFVRDIAPKPVPEWLLGSRRSEPARRTSSDGEPLEVSDLLNEHFPRTAAHVGRRRLIR